MNKFCIFDSNGTLFDTSALDVNFIDIFGNALYREIWFKTVLHTSLVLTFTDDYKDFSKISEQTLISLAEAQGIEVSKMQKAAFTAQMQTLPLYDDVLAGLAALQEAGYVLAILTNSTKKVAEAQLSHVGILEYFAKVMSTDSADAYKPAVQPYNYALKELKAELEDCWLIAGHAWDIAGADEAGLKTALLKRTHHGMNDCFPKPDVSATSLVELAHDIVEKDRPIIDRLTGTRAS